MFERIPGMCLFRFVSFCFVLFVCLFVFCFFARLRVYFFVYDVFRIRLFMCCYLCVCVFGLGAVIYLMCALLIVQRDRQWKLARWLGPELETAPLYWNQPRFSSCPLQQYCPLLPLFPPSASKHRAGYEEFCASRPWLSLGSGLERILEGSAVLLSTRAGEGVAGGNGGVCFAGPTPGSFALVACLLFCGIVRLRACLKPAWNRQSTCLRETAE